MRWVDVKTGLKQRMNEILGTSDNSGSSDLTYWSIQSAMMENVRRLGEAMVGDSPTGRILKGCQVESYYGKTIKITPGICLSKDGYPISFRGVTALDLSSYAGSTVLVNLLYENAVITEALNPTIGKSTGRIAKESVDIINDNTGVDLNVNPEDLVNISTSSTTPSNGCTLAVIDVPASADITNSEIVNYSSRGMYPNYFDLSLGSVMKVGGIISSGRSSFSETVTFADIVVNNITINGNIAGNVNFTGQVTFSENTSIDDTKEFQLPSGASKVKVGSGLIGYSGTVNPSTLTNMTITNGIITGTPSS